MSVYQQAKDLGGLALHECCTRVYNCRVFWRAEVTIRFQIGRSRLIFRRIRIIVQRIEYLHFFPRPLSPEGGRFFFVSRRPREMAYGEKHWCRPCCVSLRMGVNTFAF